MVLVRVMMVVVMVVLVVVVVMVVALVMLVVLLMWLYKFSRALSEFWRPKIQCRPRAGQSQALLLTLTPHCCSPSAQGSLFLVPSPPLPFGNVHSVSDAPPCIRTTILVGAHQGDSF